MQSRITDRPATAALTSDRYTPGNFVVYAFSALVLAGTVILYTAASTATL